MGRRRLPDALRWTLASVALGVMYAVIPVHPEPDVGQLVLRWGLSVAMLAALVLVIRGAALRQIREPDAPYGPLIVGILAGLLLFALIDYTVAVRWPGQFNGLETRIDALYFALSTQLTVGFGDVNAKGQGARMLLCAQMTFNFTVIAGSATLLARKFAARARRSAHRRPERTG